MEYLDSNSLKQVEGGAVKTVVAILAGVAVFVVGVLDGFLRPLKTLKKRK